jgi:hypothetical protein
MTMRADEPVPLAMPFNGLAPKQSDTRRILDTQPLVSSEIEFSFLNINLVVRAGALANLQDMLSDRRQRAEVIHAHIQRGP